MEYQARMMLKFGAKYPEIADNLELNVLGSDDPSVAKLLEAAAFLNAGCQETIEAMFPEYTNMALDILNPGLLAPVLPMGIARFNIQPGEREALHVPKDSTLEAITTTVDKCILTTAFDTKVFPVVISEAAFESPLAVEAFPVDQSVESVLRIRIESSNPLPLFDFTDEKLRLYINGKSNVVAALFDLMFPECQQIVILPDKKDPIFLPSDTIQPVGLEDEEAILPGFREELGPYRLLQEFFCIPNKFNFIDIANLGNAARDKIDLLFLLTSKPGFKVSPENFLVGCTPVCNRFKENYSVDVSAKATEGHELEFSTHHSAHTESITELHSIEALAKTTEFDDKSLINRCGNDGANPFDDGSQYCWSLRRAPTWRHDLTGRVNYLSFRDIENRRVLPDVNRVYLKTICFNRDLARKIIANAELIMPDRIPGISSIDLIAKPTETIYPDLEGKNPWQMISTLSLNHLSMVDHGSGEALKALKSIIQVHNIKNDSRNHKLIRGLVKMETEKTIERFKMAGIKGWESGLEITLTMDPAMFVNGSAFLFGAILDRFFPLYMVDTNYTATVLKRPDSEEEWYRWPHHPGRIPII